MSKLKTRLRALLQKSEIERELDEELRYHIEQQTEQNIRLGMNPEEARHAARRTFGGVEQAKERSRDARGVRWIEDIWQDLRFGVRMSLKRKGFTAVAVLTLALGIGANTAIFSVVNAVLLRPLPFADAERLVMIWETHPDIPRAPVSIPDFQDWRAQSQSFEEMAVHADRLRNALLIWQDEPATVQGSYISQNLFPMLGLKPVLGRNFLPEEERRENNRVVILSHALWRQSFAADPSVIGKTIQLNNDSSTVVGVMGEQYPLDMDIWLPLTHVPAADFVDRDHHPLTVIGRLKFGATLERARIEMNAIAARLQLEYPGSNKNIGVELLPLRQQLVGNLQPAVLLAFAAVGLILLIACSNVSNLFLAQAAGRQKELALRAALGAGRGRLARQLLLEGLLLALLGAVAGLVLAKCSLPLLRTGLMEMGAAKIPGLESIGIEPSTLAFTFGVTALTGLLFGILPALQFSRVDLNQMLKEGFNRSTGSGRRNISRLLVAAEVALAVIVLVGAGLLVRSFQRLSRIDPGFHAQQLLSLKIDLPSVRYSKQLQPARSMEELLSNSFARRRLTTALLSVFALLALLLAAIGIYGVVAYSVIQRTQEIGIRMTLGAQASDVLKLIIRHGIAPVLLGLTFGLASAMALTRWMTGLTAGLLFDVHPGDPATLAAIAALLVTVALLACWIPARRATKVDPIIILRAD